MSRHSDGWWRAVAFLLLCALLWLPAPLFARELAPLSVSGEGAFDEKAEEHRVKATLWVLPPGRDATSDRFRVGVVFEPDEHWHIYWKNSGDAGLSTQITWTLTQGGAEGEAHELSFTQMSWPMPHVFVQGEGAITTYGYSEEVLHEALIPESFWSSIDPTRAIEIAAKLNYLTCEVECIPGQHTLSLSYLPSKVDDEWRGERLSKFNTYQAMWPVDAASDPLVEVSSQGSHSGLRVGDEGVWRVALRLVDGARFPEYEDPSHLLLPELVEGVKLAVREVRISDDRQEAVVDVGWRVTATKPLSEPVRFVAVFRAQDRAGEARAFSVSEVWQEGILSKGASVEQSTLTPLVARGDVSAARQPAMSRAGGSGGAGEAESVSFMYALWLALLGGLLLNIMPCVFPVLSIKLAGIAQVAHHERGVMLRHGLAYAAGVVSAMMGLALAVIVLKVVGIEAGWGFQFQSPTFLLVLIGVLTLFAINLFGAFEFGTPMGGQMQDALSEERSPWRQSFLEGLLCVALATPCSAPFMGTAIGFALASSWIVILTIFVMLGVGLALPFVVLCAWPAWTRFLPRPGAWLDKLKYVLGWCVLVTCVWLLWLLGQSGGVNAMAVALVWMCVLAALGAVYGLVQYRAGRGAVALKIFVLAGLISSFLAARHLSSGEEEAMNQVASIRGGGEEGRWRAFDEEAIRADVASGKVVFVDFTADWCITCKVNERGVLESERVLDAAREHDVVWYKADWTHRDDRIRAILKDYGKGGVPMYLIYGENYKERGLLLSELLTEQMVIEGFEAAKRSL